MCVFVCYLLTYPATLKQRLRRREMDSSCATRESNRLRAAFITVSTQSHPLQPQVVGSGNVLPSTVFVCLYVRLFAGRITEKAHEWTFG